MLSWFSRKTRSEYAISPSPRTATLRTPTVRFFHQNRELSFRDVVQVVQTIHGQVAEGFVKAAADGGQDAQAFLAGYGIGCARRAPDGHWHLSDPQRPGKNLMVVEVP